MRENGRERRSLGERVEQSNLKWHDHDELMNEYKLVKKVHKDELEGRRTSLWEAKEDMEG